MTAYSPTLFTAGAHARIYGDAVELIGPDQYLMTIYSMAKRPTVSASEIAAVMGISPYTSAFDLYWRKRSGDDIQAEHKGMRRGRRLEGLVVEDYHDAHPETSVSRPGLLANKDRPWQTATPDGVLYEAGESAVSSMSPLAALEAKTAGSRDGWGQPGTDQIPVHYRAQCLWQLDVLGVDVCEVAVWFGTDYREYTITRDKADLALMRDAAQDFLNRLTRGNPPPIDGSESTTRRLQHLHQTVHPDAIDLPRQWVTRRNNAAKRAKDATEQKDRYENLIRARLGDHKFGHVDGEKAVSRSVYTVHEHTMPEYIANRLYFKREAT